MEAHDGARDFLSAHQALIHRLASKILRGYGARLPASDVAQEVMATMLAGLRSGRLDPGCIRNPRAYFCVMIRRAAWRALQATPWDSPGVPADETKADSERFPTPEAATVRADTARAVLQALEGDLYPRDAAALTLLVEEGLDIAEVADRLGCTRNTVYQMRCRILAAARRIALSPAAG